MTKVDSAKVDSLLKFVGLKNIKWVEKNDSILFTKKFPGVELDFGGIAQGYAIDVLAAFLDKKGVNNYCLHFLRIPLRAIGLNAIDLTKKISTKILLKYVSGRI